MDGGMTMMMVIMGKDLAKCMTRTFISVSRSLHLLIQYLFPSLSFYVVFFVIISLDDASEEDDSSWKVRRASIRCLSAFIRTKADILQNYYETILATLINRMKERDHNVKVSDLKQNKR